jgi:cytochrome c peroxidase
MLVRRLGCLLIPAAAALAQLPTVPFPVANPPTPAKVTLGKILFWEEQLSSDDSIACGTCHLPEFGGGDPRTGQAPHPGPDGLFATADDVFGSPGLVRQANTGEFRPQAPFGLGHQATGRVAGTHIGAAYFNDLFWDTRASTQFDDPETGQTLIPYGGALESQALGPILSAVEMGREGRTWQDVRQKLQQVRPLRLASALPGDVQAALQQNPTYPGLFAAAFGDPAITAARIAFALASYQRTQIADDTPWDRYMGGDPNALSPPAKTGWQLFQGIGRCTACHLAPLFHDDQVHVLGLRPAAEDLGTGAITGSPFDDGAFKTPTLRNAGLRPRLFHNGQSTALQDPAQTTDPGSVLNVYWNGGGVDRSNLDPFLLDLRQQGVTQADMQLIVAFVAEGLTDARARFGLAPFDHPQLRSIALPPPRQFGFGFGGAREPFVVDAVPAWPGNAAFKLGLAAGAGTSLAWLGYGFRSLEPGPVFAGLPWNVDLADGRMFPLAGAPGEPAHTTWMLPVPPDPNLAHLPLYLQLFALDAWVPGGVTTSRGVEFFVR